MCYNVGPFKQLNALIDILGFENFAGPMQIQEQPDGELFV
jgi:hypothetical protein